MDNNKKIVLIDGNSIFYRSFYALPLLTTLKGEYSNAVYGFAIQIVKIITDIKPTHIIVAFDAGKKTFRNKIFNGYKATRKPMADELRSQIEPLKKMLGIMNIKFVEEVGFEGDDILGMLVTKFKDHEKIIVTGDRDTLQLIDDKTTIYFTKKGVSEVKVMGKAELDEEYGIPASSIVDLKALQGDTSDNIPGAKGVGPKTALSLIKQFGTIDNVFDNIENIDTKTREKLEASRLEILLSKELARIVREDHLDVSLDDAKYEFPFSSEVYEFFEYFNFRTLLKRPELFGEKFVSLKKSDTETQKIDTIHDLQQFLKDVERTQKLALFVDEDENILLAASAEKEYVVLAKRELFSLEISHEILFDRLRSVLASEKYHKIFFDSKSVLHYLSKFDCSEVKNYDDISIIKHLVSGLSIKSVVDLGLPDVTSTPVACELIDSLGLFSELDDLGMMELYRTVELPLVDVLFKMEKTGFKVDTNKLEEIGQKLLAEISEIKKDIFDMVGTQFNMNSPKQLSEILYDRLSLPHSKKKRSTDAETLEKIQEAHPIVGLILRYRKIEKLRSTYIDGLRGHIDKNGFVHTSFKQTLTTTGRLSSVDPNLQNIPVRSDESREIRSMYTASREGNILIDADYSQIELRLLAHLSGDEFFVESFQKGLDIHTQTASSVFAVREADVTPIMRRIAKVVNFGIIYGISEFGLASDLKCSNKQAREFIENFYGMHPKIREYLDGLVIQAKDTGRVSTILGRTRAMPEINSTNFMVRSRAERASQNMPLQGSASDIIKIAMIAVTREFEKRALKAKLIMQVHDELIVDCPKDEEQVVREILKDKMENAVSLSVPLEIEIQSAFRWSEAH